MFPTLEPIILHKQALLVSLLSLISALFFNEYNLSVLQNTFPVEYSNRYTIATSDDASYLAPPDNFLKGEGWHSNDQGSGAWLFRTPGYGCFILICKFIAGDHALYFLRSIQLLLFAFSIYLFFISVYAITNNNPLALTTSCIYGILPFMQGFIYYTLTEGITPFLVMLFAYFIIQASKKSTIKFLYLASVTLSILIIVRPQMLILFITYFPFYYSLLKSEGLRKSKMVVLTTAISFCLLVSWQIRNYILVQKWVPLNAVYNPDNNSIFRPQHEAIGNFYKIFGADGNLFHQTVNRLWQKSLSGDTAESIINAVLTGIPPKIISCVGKQNIISAFKSYQQCSFEQKHFLEQNLPMPITKRKNEDYCVSSFNKLTIKVTNCYPFATNFLNPFKVYFKLSANSNLSLYIFQNEWRGKWFMETLRWLCLIIHLLLFSVFIFQLFIRFDKLSAMLLVTPLVYLVYLCYFQVMVEERYTMPVIPLLFIGSVRIVQLVLGKVNIKRNNS